MEVSTSKSTLRRHPDDDDDDDDNQSCSSVVVKDMDEFLSNGLERLTLSGSSQNIFASMVPSSSTTGKEQHQQQQRPGPGNSSVSDTSPRQIWGRNNLQPKRNSFSIKELFNVFRDGNGLWSSSSSSSTTTTKIMSAASSFTNSSTNVTSSSRKAGNGGNDHRIRRLSRARCADEISDKLIANRIHKQSAQDRETILHEVHGISADVEETDELIDRSILQVLEELHKLRSSSVPSATPIPPDATTGSSIATETTPLVSTTTNSNNGQNVVTTTSTSSSSTHTNNDNNSNNNMGPLERAIQQDPTYVTDRNFILPFLRTDRYDPIQTAKRIVRYFEEKERLFGTHMLCRKILLKDLDERCRTILDGGQFQILPGRDQGGRTIIISPGSLFRLRTDPLDVRAALQAFWKLSQTAMEDELTQKKGIVIIAYNLGGIECSGAELKGLHKLHTALPGRMVSMHACVDDVATKALVAVSVLLSGDHTTTRYRCHSGSHMEVQYALNTFGIPNRLLPISSTGEIDVLEHQKFLKQLQVQEELICGHMDGSDSHDELPAMGVDMLSADFMPDPIFSGPSTSSSVPLDTMGVSVESSIVSNDSQTLPSLKGLNKMSQRQATYAPEFVVVPSEFDVLLGRGKIVHEHIGNVRYRHTLSTYKEKYEGATKLTKSEIIDDIVNQILLKGGRFLEQNHQGGCWVSVSFDTARQKVSHYFRNQKRMDAKRAMKAATAAVSQPTNVVNVNGYLFEEKRTSPSKDVDRERLRDDHHQRYENNSIDPMVSSSDRIHPVLFNDVLGDQDFNSMEYFHQQVKRRRSGTVDNDKQIHPFASVFDDGEDDNNYIGASRSTTGQSTTK